MKKEDLKELFRDCMLHSCPSQEENRIPHHACNTSPNSILIQSDTLSLHQSDVVEVMVSIDQVECLEILPMETQHDLVHDSIVESWDHNTDHHNTATEALLQLLVVSSSHFELLDISLDIPEF